jgi:AcrR family transcriptional regulator
LLLHRSLPCLSLHRKDVFIIDRFDRQANLYSVKIVTYNGRMAKKPSDDRASRAGIAKSRSAAKAVSDKKPAARRGRPSDDAPYHHGALHGALLEAAERVLERDGLAGLTLRAVAREAGVSHAAPTHHFGDLTGLVSELAAIGFRQFNAAMTAAGATGVLPMAKSLARAKAYVAYAQAHPGMYGLMFRTERLDMSRPSLHEAANASFAGLAGAIGASRHEQISETALSLDQGAAIARAWSLVHGFTMLLLDDRLSDILRRLPPGTDAETLLDAMLKSTIGRSPEH